MNVNNIEVHYFLPKGQHSADAFVLARAEVEFISIIKGITSIIEVDSFKLETQALSEGGIRQVWNAVGKNHKQITIILLILTNIIALRPQNDRELIALQKEEKKLNIERLKEQLKDSKEKTIDLDLLSDASHEINSNIKIVRRKSNFYQTIEKEERISSIRFTLRENEIPKNTPVNIQRSEFPEFVALTGELPTQKDEDALISIISPVLTGEKYLWKGIYEGRTIDFRLQDKEFKESVLQKQIEFHNGTTLRCVLEIKSKINEIGEVSQASFNVKVVKSVSDESNEKLTESGKLYLAKQKQDKAQLNLF